MSNNRQHHATIGRQVRTLPILTVADKMRIKVDADAKANERVRAVEVENARLRREREYDALALQNREIVDIRAETYGFTSKEETREKHVLDGALARYRAKKLPPADFQPHELLKADAIRRGKALPLPAKDASPTQLPPSPQEGRVLPNDRAGFVAAQQPYAARSASHREQELRDRQQADDWYRKHPWAENPFDGSHRNIGGLG